MVMIDGFLEDQMGTIDASVVSLLHGCGYEDSERLAAGQLARPIIEGMGLV